ncbi:MAG TPA: hypothetical protein VJA46_08595 [Acidimicrobiia bacterium]|nr:hypothetical protein [Acidimicrobiia bacterium]
MTKLDRNLDLGSTQMKEVIWAAPTPSFRPPGPHSKVTVGLAAAAITFALILPVAVLLDSEVPSAEGGASTLPTTDPGDFETMVGQFTRAAAVEGFSELRDFVNAAAATSFGLVAVGHHTELEGEPRAWIAPADGPWSPIDLSGVDLTGVEWFADVIEIDGQLALLALDILEFDGDPAKRRLLALTSSDLFSWTITDVTPVEALQMGFTNVISIAVSEDYSLLDATRFGGSVAAIGVGAGSDYVTLEILTSSDSGNTWRASEQESSETTNLNAISSNSTRLVAVGEERSSEIDGFTPLVLWSLDGQTWHRGDIEHSSEVDTRVHDVISIDGGFLAQGSTFASDAVTTGSYWASATGEVWKRVEISGLNEMGTISYDQGMLRLFMSPSLEANSDRTGALEIWQGTIEVVPSL